MIFTIIIGAAIGWFFHRSGRYRIELVPAVALGIGGAFAGGMILKLLLAVLGVLAWIIGAVVGALIAIAAWNAFASR